MRVEVPNRTADSDKKLQNSTNNLINRQEHKRFFMISWHITGANRTSRNLTRNMVLHRAATARPPLPPNSTRGLTPGLINPRLGNIPGNRIPFSTLRQSQGRLRVTGRPQITQAAAAASIQAQEEPVQENQGPGSSAQNNEGRESPGPGHKVPSKRSRASPLRKGRPSKRQTLDLYIDDMDTRSDETKSSKVWIDTSNVLWILLTSLRTHRHLSPSPDLKKHEPAPGLLDLLRVIMFLSGERVDLQDRRRLGGRKIAPQIAKIVPRRAKMIPRRLSLETKRIIVRGRIPLQAKSIWKEIPASRLHMQQADRHVANVKTLDVPINKSLAALLV